MPVSHGFRPLARTVPKASLLTLAFAASLGAPAIAQTVTLSCSSNGATQSCTAPVGSYTQPILQHESTDSVSLDSASTLNLTANTSTTGFYGINTYTLTSASGNGASAPPAGAASVTNLGTITFTSVDRMGRAIYGILNQSVGGSGINGNSSSDAGGAGGAAQNADVTNQEPITLSNGGATVSAPDGAAAIESDSIGGSGGSADNGDTGGNSKAAGGNGGNAGGAGISNGASVTAGAGGAALSGSAGLAGLLARSLGGAGGSGGNGTSAAAGNGGAGGAASISDSAPVAIAWQWNGGTSNTLGVFGAAAESIGGAGGASDRSQTNGGAGGLGGGVTVDLTGNVSASATGTPPGPASVLSISANTGFIQSGITGLAGAAAAAVSTGGAGGTGYDSANGGTGGGGGLVNLDITNAAITAAGNAMAAAIAQSQGGAGGNGGYQQDHDNAGAGGDGGTVGMSLTATPSDTLSISTSGTSAPAILLTSAGGVGGIGATINTFSASAGAGGDGGDGGTVALNTSTAGSALDIATTGAASPGMLIQSIGGDGGLGGSLYLYGVEDGSTHGDGGAGGAGGAVTVNLVDGTSVQTQGNGSSAVLIRSLGGTGGNGGELSIDLGDYQGFNGGNGGATGKISVTIASGVTLTTHGDDASGLVVQSASGAGGAAGETVEPLGEAVPGSAGNGGATDTITVANSAAITTAGANARGILVQGLSGGGGAGSYTASALYSKGGAGGTSGAVGSITAQNAGTIKTRGSQSIAIEVQSIAGGGGAGGTADSGIVNLGGNDVAAANGGSMIVTDNGSLSTSGNGALAVLAQSIGGGGGDGGGAAGLVGVGGTGGGGGDGGAVQVNLYDTITTSGQLAAGLLDQSVGGGGGNGGNAVATSVGLAIAVGGTGGDGGAGGTAGAYAVNNSILTQGANSAGILAQSIGGGGGVGGSSDTFSAGVVGTLSVAVGGSGGSGGSGSMTTVTTVGSSIATGQAPSLVVGASSPTNTSPTSAYGILAQSIGGGGGQGGSALAQAFAVGVPVSETGTSVAVSASFAVGGSGGTGGNGSTVGVNLTNGTSILTSGQGSDAVLAQSIGGGGGAGGDGSALASTFEYGRAISQASTKGLSLTITVGVGGAACNDPTDCGGGTGGAASVAVGGTNNSADPAGSAPVSITTFGDYADGVLVQSVGGGGGNGAIGSTSTEAFGDTAAVNATAGIGGKGSMGGAGGTAVLNLFAGNSVITYGSGADGLIAQSIGGGGGASQGMTFNLGGAFSVGSAPTAIPTADLQLDVGHAGGGGGNGGSVTLTSLGTVATHGGGSTAILAQSIGGGGGLGGGSGGDASADNPILSGTGTGVREFISNIVEKNLVFGGSFTIGVGGSGGTAGTGGAVAVTAGGTVATLGDWAQGVVAQSIGGGGGMGGSAMATGASEAPHISLNVGATFASGGGAGGAGRTVDVTLQNLSLSTAGYWAYGILGQSIGGGGGVASDGSVAAGGAINVGANFSGGSGSGGAGGDVTLAANSVGAIATSGEAAHAIVLQSIGGGGGVGGQGTSVSAGALVASGSTTITAGGRGGAGGNGGSVTASSVLLGLGTTGVNAFGLLAQSIGGGGGIAGATASDNVTAVSLGGQSSSASNGGTVNLSLAAGSQIVTTGSGANGIVAQSIGGGGGIANFASGTPSYSFSPPSSGLVTNGSGGNVTVNADAAIAVSGPGAIGILAQSIGGGGGMMAMGSTVYLGSTGAGGSSGQGGVVQVTQSGSLTASGAGGIGILAQSDSAAGSTNTGSAAITINGTVSGGGGSGAGAVIAANNGGVGQLTVNTSGVLSATSGTAFINQGSNATTIDNFGTISGSLLAPQNTGSGIIVNNSGTLLAGAEIDGTVNNSATLVPGQGYVNGKTTLPTLVLQNSSVLAPEVSFSAIMGGQLIVTSSAKLAGTILPNATDIMPYALVPVLEVPHNGDSGTIYPGQSTLYRYGVSKNIYGSTDVYSIQVSSADFAPSSQALNASEQSVAGHLQAIFDAGGNAAFGPIFASLGNAADANNGSYAHALSTLTPGAALGIGAHVAPGLENFGNSLLSCPMFETNSADLREGSCSWIRANGRITNQGASSGTAGYQLRSSGIQIGGQKQFAPHWFLGGSFAYGQDWLTSSDGATSGSGQNVEAGFSLKHEVGDWLFALAGFAGHQDFRTARLIELPGAFSVADAKPLTNGGGLRLRIARTFGSAHAYLRPFLDLDGVYAAAPGYTETGAGALDLQVSGHRQLLGVATP
ncbi:MAG: autotransporter outer membrane beta-barrel domain-containing protein, partial [Rhodospirillales bacterium]|nr:autotransporter outer membrane beta-barrel domain-containing protein [Rhodospirillales bacterium]